MWFVYTVRLYWTKWIFPFFSGQFEVASGLRKGDHAYFFFWVLDPSMNLCRPCTSNHSLWEFTCVPVLLCLEGIASLVSSILTNSYNLSSSSSTNFPEPQGKGFFNQSFNLWLGVSRSLNPCTLSSCGPLCLFPLTSGGNFYNDGW